MMKMNPKNNGNPFSIGRDEKTGKFVSLKDKKKGVKVETYNRPLQRLSDEKKKKRTPSNRRPLPYIMRNRSAKK